MADIELNQADERILDVLREGRNTPSNMADRLDYSREYVAQRLKRLREHDVVDRVGRGLYELADDPGAAPPPDPTEATAADDGKDTIGAALDGWRPGRTADDRQERLASARAVLEYIRDRGRVTKQDLLTDVYPSDGVEAQNEETWWAKTARGQIDDGTGGALAVGVGAGIVERHHGPPHEYEWVGDDS